MLASLEENHNLDSVSLLKSDIEDRMQSFAKQLTEQIGTHRSLLRDYLVVVQHHHKKPIKLTACQIIKNLTPVLISYTIGGIATYSYIGAAQNAAGDNKFNCYMNVLSSVILNWFVNGYFPNEVISEVWQAFFTNLPNSVKLSLYNLQNKNPSSTAKILRGLKNTLLFLVILAPSFLSAYPFYVLDKTESDDPEFISNLILISATLLLFKGVEAFLFKAIPAIYKPIANGFNYCFNKKKYNFTILLNDIAKLKSSHKEVLENAHQHFLSLLQTGREKDLNKIYSVLQTEKPSLQSSLELLLLICQLGISADKNTTNQTILKIVQLLSLVMTTASLPGYFLKTEVSAAEFFNIQDPKAEFLLGASIYFITVALSYDVSWEVFGKLHETFVYAKNGIKTNWQNSTSAFEFLKNIVTGIPYKKSWHTIIRLPLAIQQSPQFMLPLFSFFLLIAHWSVNISHYLNEQQLGSTIASWLFLPTELAVLAFNLYPIHPVAESAQQTYVKTCGNEKLQTQLQLEECIKRFFAELKGIDDINFMKLLNIISNLPLDQDVKEGILKTLLGGRAQEVLGDKHQLAQQDLCHMTNFLNEKLEHESFKLSSSRFSLFKTKNEIPINQEELYKTFKSYSATF